MSRAARIYTRTGDDGTTGVGSGPRASKTAPRIEAYGAVDELNAHVGTALAAGPARELCGPLQQIQSELLHLGADLCSRRADQAEPSGARIDAPQVESLERLIDTLSARLPPLKNFILPGGTPAAAALHVARTVCRRAERAAVALAAAEPVGGRVVPYLNRLSDALFVMARFQNQQAGVAETVWSG